MMKRTIDGIDYNIDQATWVARGRVRGQNDLHITASGTGCNAHVTALGSAHNLQMRMRRVASRQRQLVPREQNKARRPGNWHWRDAT
jgi:hypothetical protein